MDNSHQQNTELKGQTEESMGSNRAKTNLWCQQVGLPLEGSSGTKGTCRGLLRWGEVPFFDLGANYTGENPSSCAWRVLQLSASMLT